MELTVDGITDGERIPVRLAFCAGDEMGDNVSPALQWTGVPAGTRSIAITCVDPDAPSDATDVNQEGRTVPADLPRADFAHWLLVDLPAATTELAEAAEGTGIVPHGKPVAGGALGGVRGANDFTSWFEGDAEMEGVYGGYDGPCPPWNDSIVHHYTYTVHALDVPSLGLAPGFRLADFEAAIDGHVVASAAVTGLYSLNPAVG
ncbi:MAG: YbhB/YbcL family Raf kinase inhibitor-like protein [Acidimicrobiales bacterium]